MISSFKGVRAEILEPQTLQNARRRDKPDCVSWSSYVVMLSDPVCSLYCCRRGPRPEGGPCLAECCHRDEEQLGEKGERRRKSKKRRGKYSRSSRKCLLCGMCSRLVVSKLDIRVSLPSIPDQHGPCRNSKQPGEEQQLKLQTLSADGIHAFRCSSPCSEKGIIISNSTHLQLTQWQMTL